LNTQALCLIDHASNFCGSYSLST